MRAGNHSSHKTALVTSQEEEPWPVYGTIPSPSPYRACADSETKWSGVGSVGFAHAVHCGAVKVEPRLHLWPVPPFSSAAAPTQATAPTPSP